MLTAILLTQPVTTVPVKDVDIPPALYWYMGAALVVCAVVFFVLPFALSTKRSAQRDTTDADHD